jgi:hypothetical protein
MDNIYKSDNVSAAPIRVMNLLYNSGVCFWFDAAFDILLVLAA